MCLGCLNEARISCAVDENNDGGGGGCPMDWVCPNGVRISLMVHELLVCGI